VLFFTNIIFKIDVRGLENIPDKKGALIISNHVSFLDNLVIIAAMPRDIGFVMAAAVYNNKALNWLLKKLPMVPIETGKDRSYLEKFNADCASKINEGNLVCIYAEGQISRNGHLLPFKKGLEFIGKKLEADVPIIPIHIDGLLGTPLSYDNINKRTVKFSLKKLRQKVTVTIGTPLENSKSAFEVRQAVKELEVRNFSERISLDANLVDFARMNFKNFQHNEIVKNIKASEFWFSAESFAQKHKNQLSSYGLVGVQLDSLSENIVTNIALSMLGIETIDLSMEQNDVLFLKEAGVDFVISNKALDFPHLIFEYPELKREFHTHQPIVKNQKIAKFNTQRTFFEMTHENILAYLFALKQLFALGSDSKIFCQYHTNTAIGYFIKIWTPFLTSSKILGKDSCSEANVLIGNAQFLTDFHQKFGSKQLRTIVLFDDDSKDLPSDFNRDSLFQGLRSNSACPVLTLSSPNYVGKSLGGQVITQEGKREESVGRPLPGITIKVVNEIGESLEPETFGQVFAKGALFSEKGWINTGITGKMTEDGFLEI
jgi:acyl-[acyl-carrier-protein]-phospholipid O-acyltransferase/long-chain-fatty-acid--[acyl-carrier-protein] ligase